MTQSPHPEQGDGNLQAGERRRRDTSAGGETPEVPRSITIIYLVALCLIAGISITSHFLTNRIVAKQESTALLVNTAGRQRMLSQRITRIAEEIADGSIDPRAGRSALGLLADRMETAQHQLTFGDIAHGMPPATSPRLRAIYYEPPLRLESQVNSFLAHTRAFIAKPNATLGDPDLRAMVAAANEPLLNGLDTAVSEYQAASEHDVRHLRHVISTLTGIMLIVLVLEALLIYRPLFNRLTGAISLLIKASTTDFLTGVLNRRAFVSGAERELTGARRKKQSLCLLMADIDHFKQVNDTYGHPAGDLVIKHFAAVCEANLRTGDSVGRMGGEEFAILMPGASLPGAQLAAERIRERFSRTTAAVTPHGQRVLATVSIGVVCATDGTVSHLLAEADALLYRAKQGGRNRVETGHSAAAAEMDTAAAELAG